ncbi:MAG TPA: hypothetical protein VGD66_15770 [Allosphingosinicella sp.]
MPVTEMIIGVSAGLFMLTGFVFFLRLIQAWLLHRTLREAIKRDSAVAATLVDRVGRGDVLAVERAASGNDDRTGMVLIAVGVALAGFSLIAGDPEWLRYGFGGALFPVLIGAALLLRHYMLGRPDETDVAAGS